MRIFLAGSLFSEAEKAFNERLTTQLEVREFSVFMPQRDGVENWTPLDKNMPTADLRREMFAVDPNEILKADIFLFVLDGRVPDEGACVELGIAYSHKFLQRRDKLLLGLLTDRRAAFPDAKLNAMIEGALDSIAANEVDLIAGLEVYRTMKATAEPSH